MNRNNLKLIVETFLSAMRKDKISLETIRQLRMDRNKANKLDTSGKKNPIFSKDTVWRAQEETPIENKEVDSSVPALLKHRFSNTTPKYVLGGSDGAFYGDFTMLSPTSITKNADILHTHAHEQGHRLVANVIDPSGHGIAAVAKRKEVKTRGDQLDIINNEKAANSAAEQIRSLSPALASRALATYSRNKA